MMGSKWPEQTVSHLNIKIIGEAVRWISDSGRDCFQANARDGLDGVPVISLSPNNGKLYPELVFGYSNRTSSISATAALLFADLKQYTYFQRISMGFEKPFEAVLGSRHKSTWLIISPIATDADTRTVFHREETKQLSVPLEDSFLNPF